MASISLPGITRWGNPYSPLSGALGSSPGHGGGSWAPLCLGREGAGLADHTLPRECPAPVFQPPVLRDISIQPRFLVRPRLLTRL